MWSQIYDEHCRYLTDDRRMRAFTEAVRHYVRPGMVVVDVAAGSGVLAVLAARAGARVYAIESTATYGLTCQIVAANGLADRITCLRGRSFDIDVPEPADVIIGDQLDGFIVDAGLLDTHADACRRFLGPGGRSIPGAVDWWVAPIEAPRLRDALRAWASSPGGVVTNPAVPLVANARRIEAVRADQVVGTPVGPIRVDLSEPVPTQLSVDGTTVVAPGAVVDALAGWFDAELAPGVRITNDPRSPARINRSCAVFPLQRADPASPAGSALHIDVRPASHIVTWQLGAGPVHGSPFEAPLTRQSMAEASGDHVPVLNSRGRMERRLLGLCDGRRSRAEIQRVLLEEFADRLPSPEEAVALVAKALDAYDGHR